MYYLAVSIRHAKPCIFINIKFLYKNNLNWDELQHHNMNKFFKIEEKLSDTKDLERRHNFS